MDSVKVAIRIRPLIAREQGSEILWTADTHQIKLKEGKSKPYIFDRVFDSDEITGDVYEEIVEPIVQSAMGGFNGTVFAYGQTSSGKTYTMMGDRSNPGIIPLSVNETFALIQKTPEREFLLRVSYMEIYNEVVRDLLAPTSDGPGLQIREDEFRNAVVHGLTEKLVMSSKDVLKLMEAGDKKRHTGCTNMNERSSRSHTIFRMIIESRERAEHDTTRDSIDSDSAIKVSQLNLVDLAGSERASQTGAEGQRLKEGCHINKSLSTLGLVINQICKASESGQSAQFISYRDSKLTRILQPALGGNSLTAIICAVTPASADDTDSTLRFASSAKKIKNKPHVNEVLSDEALLYKQKREINQLKKKIQQLELTSGKKQTAELETMLEEKDKLQKEQEDKIQTLKNIILVSTQPADSKRQRAIRRETWCPGKLAAAPSRPWTSPRMDATLLNQSSFFQKLDQTMVSSEFEPIAAKRARFLDFPTTTRPATREPKPMTPGTKLRADEASNKFESLEDEVVRMKKRQDELEDELLEVRAAKNKHLQEREALNLKVMRMQGQITAQRETLDDVIEEKNQLEEEKENLESKIKDQNTKISEYVRRENQWENSNPDVRVLRNENMDLCDQLREVCSQNRKLQEKADEERDSIEYLQSMLEEVNKDAKKKEQSMDSQLEQFKNQVSELQTQLEATFANNTHSPTSLVDVNKLEEELKSLKTELDKSNAQLEEQKQENLTLKAKLEEIGTKEEFSPESKPKEEEDSKNKDEEIENLLAMLEEQAQENAILKKQLENGQDDSVFASENEKLMMDLENLRIEIGRLQQELAYKDSEIEEQKKLLELKPVDESQTMNVSVKIGEKTFGDALNQCEVLIEQRDDARNNCKILQEELEKLRAEKESMKSPSQQRTDLNESVKFGEKTMNDALGACEDLIEERDRIKIEFENLKSEYEEIKSECEKLRQKITIMEEHEEFIQAEKDILFEEEKENLQKITHLKEQVEQQKSEIVKLQNQYSENNGEIIQTPTEKESEAELQHLREEICNLLKSSEDAQEMLQESNKNLAIAQTTVESQKVQIEELEKELKRVKSDVESFDTMAELTKEKYERRIKELTEQLQNAYNEMGGDVPKDAPDSSSQSNDEFGEYKILLDQKESEIENLTGKLQSSSVEMEELRTQLEICEEKLFSMSKMNAQNNDSDDKDSSEIHHFLSEKNLCLEDLKARLEEYDSLVADKLKFLTELETGSNKISELEEQLRVSNGSCGISDDMRNKIEKLEKTISERDGKIEEMRMLGEQSLGSQNTEDARNKLDSLSSLLQEKDSQNSTLVEKMSEMETLLTQKEENIKSLQENLKVASKKHEDLARQLEEVFVISNEDCSEKVLREELANARRELSEMKEKNTKLHTETEHAQGALLAETNRELDQQRLLQISERQRRESALVLASERESSNKQINELLSKVNDLQSSLCKANVEKDVATRQSDKMTQECDFLKKQVKELENIHNNQASVIPRNQAMDPDKMAVKIKQLSLNLDLTKQTSDNLAAMNKKLQDENKKLEGEVVRVMSLQGEVTRLEAILDHERQTRKEETERQKIREKESSEMRNKIMELQKLLREAELDLENRIRESSVNLSSITGEKKLLQDELNFSKQRISSLEHSVQDLKEKEEEARLQYEGIQSEFDSMKASLEEAESKNEEFLRNNESLKDQFTHSIQMLNEQKEKFTQADEQNRILIEDLDSHKQELESRLNLLKNEENKNELLQQNLEQMKQKLEHMKQEAENVRSEILAGESSKQEEMKMELEQLRSDLAESLNKNEEIEKKMLNFVEDRKVADYDNETTCIQLQEKYNSLIAEKDTLVNEKEETEQKITFMQEQLAEMQAEKDILMSARNEFEKKCLALQDDIQGVQNEDSSGSNEEVIPENELQENSNKEQDNSSNLIALKAEAEQKLLQLQDELQVLQTEKYSLLKRVESLESERKDVRNTSEGSSIQNDRLQEQYDALMIEKDSLQLRMHDLERDVALKNEQFPAVENNPGIIQNSVDENSDEKEELIIKISDLESELEEMIMAKEEVAKLLEEEKESHEAILCEMNKNLQMKDEEIQLLQSSFENSAPLQEELDTIKTQLIQKEGQMTNCHSQIENLEKKCQSLQEELDQAGGLNKDDDGIGFAASLDQELIENLSDQVAELKIQIEEKDEQISDLMKSVETLKAGKGMLTSSEDTSQVLKQEIENLKTQVDTLTETLRTKEEELNEQIYLYSKKDNISQKSSGENHPSQDFEAEIARLTDLSSEKDNIIHELKNRVEENCGYYENHREEISTLSTQLEEKNFELSVLQQKIRESEVKVNQNSTQILEPVADDKVADLMNKLEVKAQEIVSLKSVKDELEANLNAEKSDFEKKLSVLFGEKEDIRTKVDELSIEIQNKDERIQQLTVLEEELKLKISEFTTQQDEVDKLRKYKEEAGCKISELESLRSSEEEAMAELKGQLLDLRKSLEREDSRINELKKTKTEVEDNLKNTKQEKDDLLVEIEKLKQDVELKDSMLEKTREELEMQENLQLEEMTSEKVYLEEKCSCLQDSIASLEAMIVELKSSQEEYSSENGKMQEEISELRKSKDDLQILKSDLEAQLDELSKMLKQHEEDEDSRMKEIALLQTDLELEREKSSGLDSELQSVYDMIRDKAAMMEESAASRDALEQEVEVLKRENADLNIKLEEQKSDSIEGKKMEELESKITDLTTSKDSLDSELEVAKNLNLNLEKMLLETQNKIHVLETEISGLEDSLENEKKKTDFEKGIQDNIQELKDEISHLAKFKDSLSSELEKVKKEKSTFEEKLQDSEDEISHLTKSKDSLSSELEEVKTEKSTLEEKLQDLKDSSSTDAELEKASQRELTEELELLKTKLEAATKEKEISEENIKTLKDEIAELTEKHEKEVLSLKTKEDKESSEVENLKNQLSTYKKEAEKHLEEVKGILYKKELEVQTLQSEVDKWSRRHEEDKVDLEKAINAAKDEIASQNEKNSLQIFELEEKLQKSFVVEKEFENLKVLYSEIESKYKIENEKCLVLMKHLEEEKEKVFKENKNKKTFDDGKYEKCLQDLTKEQEISKNLSEKIAILEENFAKKLAEAMKKAKADQSRLNLRIDSLEEGLMEADKEIEEEKKKYEELEKKFEESEKYHREEAGATRTRLSDKTHGETEVLKENLQRSDSKYKEEKQKTQALAQQLKTEKKRCAELIARLEDATVRNRTKHAGMDSDDSRELYMEREKNKSLTQKLTENEEEFSKRLKEVQKRLETTKKNLTNRINDLEESCMEADQEYEEEKKKNTELEEKLKNLEQQMKKSSGRITKSKGSAIDIESLKKEVEEKENMITQLRIKLTTKVEPLEREVNQLKEELKMSEERVSTLKQKMKFMPQPTEEGTKTRSGRTTRSSKQSSYCGGSGGLVVQDTKVYVLEMEISDNQRRIKFLEKELAKYKDIETKRRTENMELLEENNKYRTIIKKVREKKHSSGDVLTENSSIMNQTMSSSVELKPLNKAELPQVHSNQEDNCKNQ